MFLKLGVDASAIQHNCIEFAHWKPEKKQTVLVSIFVLYDHVFYYSSCIDFVFFFFFSSLIQLCLLSVHSRAEQRQRTWNSKVFCSWCCSSAPHCVWHKVSPSTGDAQRRVMTKGFIGWQMQRLGTLSAEWNALFSITGSLLDNGVSWGVCLFTSSFVLIALDTASVFL